MAKQATKKKNSRSKKGKQAPIAKGWTVACVVCAVLIAALIATIGAYCGMYPDAAAAVFKGESVYSQADLDAAKDKGYEAGYESGINGEPQFVNTPLENGKTYDVVYINTSKVCIDNIGYAVKTSRYGRIDIVSSGKDIGIFALRLSEAGIPGAKEDDFFIYYWFDEESAPVAIYSTKQFSIIEGGSNIKAVVGWQNVGENGVILEDGKPLKMTVRIFEDVDYIPNVLSSTPFGAFTAPEKPETQFAYTALEDGKTYDSVYFDTGTLENIKNDLAAKKANGEAPRIDFLGRDSGDVIIFAAHFSLDAGLGEADFFIGYILKTGENFQVVALYSTKTFEDPSISARPGWQNLGENGLILKDGKPLKIMANYVPGIDYSYENLSATPVCAYTPEAEPETQFAFTPLVEGEEYNEIYIDTSALDTIRAEIRSRISENKDLRVDFVGYDYPGAVIYALSLYGEVGSATEDDFVIVCQNEADDDDRHMLYSTMDFNTVTAGWQNLGENGLVLYDSRPFRLCAGYSDSRIYMYDVISATPVCAYTPSPLS